MLKNIEFRLKDLLVWWENRYDDDLLSLFFDDLNEGCVRRIANFMSVKCDDDVIAHVVHTTTHAEMARHHSKFSVHRFATVLAEKLGESPPPDSELVSRVRKDGGKSGEGKEKLPAEVQQLIDDMWQEIVTSKLGFNDLNEMSEAWKNEKVGRY